MNISAGFHFVRDVLIAFMLLIAGSSMAQTVPDPDVAQMPPPAPRTSDAVRKLAPAELVAELKRGGYVIYFRHTSTDFSQNDLQSKSFEDCARQRNLTDAGRAEARGIGAAIRELKLPIAKVLASPLCRTMETARLIFGTAEPVPEMRGAQVAIADPNRYAVLKQLFSTAYPRGSNVAVASHGNPFYGVAGPPYLAEGEAAVIQGLGNGNFEVVARIRIADWPQLTAAR